MGTEWDWGRWWSCNTLDEKSHKRTREVCFLEFLHQQQLPGGPQNHAVREVNQKSTVAAAQLNFELKLTKTP